MKRRKVVMENLLIPRARCHVGARWAEIATARGLKQHSQQHSTLKIGEADLGKEQQQCKLISCYPTFALGGRGSGRWEGENTARTAANKARPELDNSKSIHPKFHRVQLQGQPVDRTGPCVFLKQSGSWESKPHSNGTVRAVHTSCTAIGNCIATPGKHKGGTCKALSPAPLCQIYFHVTAFAEI